MKVAFAGSSSFGLPCLEALTASRHTLCGVFTQPSKPAGRHRQLKPTDVAAWCAARQIPYIETDNINHPELRPALSACGADILLVIAFGQKISRAVIDLFPKKAINVHASLLPALRGAAPIHWAIMRGLTETGISIITLADRMDAGDILAQARIAIDADDTFQTLHDKLARISPPVLTDTLDAIEAGTAVYTPQQESLATFAPKLTKADGYIDWQRPALEIANKTRALFPWPGAQSVYVSSATGKSWRVIIEKAVPLLDKTNGLGDVPGMLDQQGNVICGWNRLKILRIKPAGADSMSFEQFCRGRNSRAGDLFLPMEQVLRDLGQ